MRSRARSLALLSGLALTACGSSTAPVQGGASSSVATIALPPASGSAAPSASGASSVALAPASTPVFGGRAKLVALGSANLCVLDDADRVRCVGDWPLQTASSTRNQDVRRPLQVTGLGSVRSMVIEHPRGCAITFDGTVRCWGNTTPTPFNWTGASPGRLDAVPVDGVRDAIQLALGWSGSCALVKGGSVVCWGATFAPPMSKAPAVASPRTLPLRGVVQISAAKKRACAVLDDGTVSCWGDERQGDLAGRQPGEERPVTVRGLAGVVEVSVGNGHACARTKPGEVFCWGGNAVGELGDGTFEERPGPVAVRGLTDAVQVVASHGYSCALTRAGRVVCWGEDANARLGCALRACEQRTMRSTFGPSDFHACANLQTIPLPFAPSSIALGSGTACAQSPAGEVACWGRSLTEAAGGCAAQPL